MSEQGKLHFWLREEVKPGERRTPILPEHAQQLLNAGHTVTVEESRTRCIANEEYKKIGCKLVPSGSWVHSPRDTVILGLKDLPNDNSNLKHRHIFFAHAYKNQTGWKDLLSQFIRGEGFVWDLEYLTEENGRRVAAFGRCAGYIGMASGVLMWCHQILHPDQPKIPSLEYHENFEALVKYCKPLIEQASAKIGRKPRVLVIGALGRCGGGAVSCANDLGIESTKWDINETAGGGPFPEALEHDILLNAIYLFQKIPPFLTTEFIQKPRKLSVVVDVSCDPNNPANPLPIYSDCTTLFDPNVRIIEGSNPLDVIAIDHLPSLVPYDSSKEFADALIKHLCQTGQTDVWHRAKQIYVDKTRPIIAELNEASKHVWLRDEVVDGEKRTALTPADSKKLIVDHSFKVTVERSNSREFQDEEYEKAGCELVEAGSWKSAPMNATILGLQGLPNEDQTPIKHRHMYFGYAFKEQAGWKELLSRFAEGGGSLLDLEYLTDSNGNRLTTFAKISGV